MLDKIQPIQTVILSDARMSTFNKEKDAIRRTKRTPAELDAINR